MTIHPFAEELGKAIRGEEESELIYAEAARRTTHPSGAAMFLELAAFENHHKDHLIALRNSLDGGGDWIDYPARAWTGKGGEGKSPKLSDVEHADATTALRAAISAEEQAEAHYKELSGKAPTDAGQKMFRRLMEEEAMHRRMLDDQLYALSNQGVWLWGD